MCNLIINVMKRRSIVFCLVGGTLLCSLLACNGVGEESFETKIGNQFSVLLEQAEINYDVQVSRNNQIFFPRSLTGNGDIAYVASGDWCSGFFPGSLWLMGDLTSDTKFHEAAIKYTLLLDKEQWNGRTHDMGFKIMCSYGNALKFTNNREYEKVIIQSAKTLATRFNETVGAIRSWDHNQDVWSFPVIIDNMMNLELLFVATELTGDSSYYKIAVTHANTTMLQHFRSDYSSYHVVDFNPETGEVNEKVTHQGDADDSAWARGQAWGLYGYTTCYRYTKDPAYLNQAIKIVDFMFSHPNLPKDKIPMWDYNFSEESEEPRDVSAATISASALLELADEESDFGELASHILNSLKSHYTLADGAKHGFLLDHSVGFKHAEGEVDVPINYADYYFLEALIRQNEKVNNVNY